MASNRKTPGRQLAALRSRIVAKVRRTIAKYDQSSVTDASVLALLKEVLRFVETTDERYQKRRGGLGK